ncbi:MAG: 50S ribosomal protein L24 [Nanoarchaeota archaeon]|nr:50S ribosomal protein L24 [Nanoarchaeota archaeon]
MKKFVSSWKSSSSPRKKRKYQAQAPLHIKRHFLGAHLAKPLRVKLKIRSVAVRKGDAVKILRGQFAGKSGKVENVDTRRSRVFIDVAFMLKRDGSKVFYPLHPSNLLVTELMLDDKWRKRSLEGTKEGTK